MSSTKLKQLGLTQLDKGGFYLSTSRVFSAQRHELSKNPEFHSRSCRNNRISSLAQFPFYSFREASTRTFEVRISRPCAVPYLVQFLFFVRAQASRSAENLQETKQMAHIQRPALETASKVNVEFEPAISIEFVPLLWGLEASRSNRAGGDCIITSQRHRYCSSREL